MSKKIKDYDKILNEVKLSKKVKKIPSLEELENVKNRVTSDKKEINSVKMENEDQVRARRKHDRKKSDKEKYRDEREHIKSHSLEGPKENLKIINDVTKKKKRRRQKSMYTEVEPVSSAVFVAKPELLLDTKPKEKRHKKHKNLEIQPDAEILVGAIDVGDGNKVKKALKQKVSSKSTDLFQNKSRSYSPKIKLAQKRSDESNTLIIKKGIMEQEVKKHKKKHKHKKAEDQKVNSFDSTVLNLMEIKENFYDSDSLHQALELDKTENIKPKNELDLKGYFTTIQRAIDQKLDLFLHKIPKRPDHQKSEIKIEEPRPVEQNNEDVILKEKKKSHRKKLMESVKPTSKAELIPNNIQMFYCYNDEGKMVSKQEKVEDPSGGDVLRKSHRRKKHHHHSKIEKGECPEKETITFPLVDSLVASTEQIQIRSDKHKKKIIDPRVEDISWIMASSSMQQNIQQKENDIDEMQENMGVRVFKNYSKESSTSPIRRKKKNKSPLGVRTVSVMAIPSVPQNEEMIEKKMKTRLYKNYYRYCDDKCYSEVSSENSFTISDSNRIRFEPSDPCATYVVDDSKKEHVCVGQTQVSDDHVTPEFQLNQIVQEIVGGMFIVDNEKNNYKGMSQIVTTSTNEVKSYNIKYELNSLREADTFKYFKNPTYTELSNSITEHVTIQELLSIDNLSPNTDIISLEYDNNNNKKVTNCWESENNKLKNVGENVTILNLTKTGESIESIKEMEQNDLVKLDGTIEIDPRDNCIKDAPKCTNNKTKGNQTKVDNHVVKTISKANYKDKANKNVKPMDKQPNNINKNILTPNKPTKQSLHKDIKTKGLSSNNKIVRSKSDVDINKLKRKSPIQTTYSKSTVNVITLPKLKPKIDLKMEILKIDLGVLQKKTFSKEPLKSKIPELKSGYKRCKYPLDRKPYFSPRSKSVKIPPTEEKEILQQSINFNRSKSELNSREISKVNFCKNTDKLVRSGNKNRSLSGSLDKYLPKTNSHTSSLFLTKQYKKSQVSSFQKRKNYDENIRKKLKQKQPATKDRVVPQKVFEVRFLTVSNNRFPKKKKEIVMSSSENTSCNVLICCSNSQTNSMCKCQEKVSILGGPKTRRLLRTRTDVRTKKNSLGKVKNPGKAVTQLDLSHSQSQPKIDESFDKDASNKINVTTNNELKNQDIKPSVVLSTIQDNEVEKTIATTMTNVSVADITTSTTPVTHSIILKTDDFTQPSQSEVCNSQDTSLIKQLASMLNIDSSTENKKISNIKQAIESLLKMQSVKNVPSGAVSKTDYGENTQMPKSVIESSTSVQKNINISSHVIPKSKEPIPMNIILNQSCPTLNNISPSFDFLYEKCSDISSSSWETPTVCQMANINSRNIVVSNYPICKERHIAPTSEESGYTSGKSKKCYSVTNFFKRSSIRALFRPISYDKERHDQENIDCLAYNKGNDYIRMNKECQLYARKVAECKSSTVKHNYREIPLGILLGNNSMDDIQEEIIQDQKAPSSLVKSESSKKSPRCRYSTKKKPAPPIKKYRASKNSVKSSCKAVKVPTKQSIECVQDMSVPSITTTNMSNKDNSIESINKPIDSNTTLQYSESKSSTIPSTMISTEVSANKSDVKSKNHETNLSCTEVASSYELEEVFVAKTDSSKNLQMNTSTESMIENNELDEFVQNSSELTSPVTTEQTSLVYDNKESVIYVMNNMKSQMCNNFFKNVFAIYEKEIKFREALLNDEQYLKNEFAPFIMKTEESFNKSVKVDLKKQPKMSVFGKFFKRKSKVYKRSIEPCETIVATVGETSKTTNLSDLEESVIESRKLDVRSIAHDARRRFSCLVQAICTTKDVDCVIKYSIFLKILECVEKGDISVIRKDDGTFHDTIKEDIRLNFQYLYEIASTEAHRLNHSLIEENINLIKFFVIKYCYSLLFKFNTIAEYIGTGKLNSKEQIKGAVRFFLNMDNSESLDVTDFEKMCSLKCNVVKCK